MQRITGDLRQLQGDANTAMSCQHRFWGAEGTQGAHRGHTDTCGHEEHLYPFLFSCCFTGALPGCAVFFPLPSCRHALVAAALCIRSRSSNDSSASSGRESDAHLSPAASHGASCPGGGDKRHDRSAAAPPRPPGSGKPPRLVAPRGSSLWRRSRPSAQPPAPSLAPLPPRAPQPPPSAGRSARTPFPQRSAASPGRTRRQTRCLTFRRRAHHLLPAAAPHTAPRRPPHGRPPPPRPEAAHAQSDGRQRRTGVYWWRSGAPRACAVCDPEASSASPRRQASARAASGCGWPQERASVPGRAPV